MPHPKPSLRRALLALLLISLPTLTVSVRAQTRTAAPPAAATGTITGEVRNAVTKQLLNMARVTVRESGQISFTDTYGHFRLNDVPGGTATLEIFYTELDPLIMTVDVPAGGIANQALELTSVARYGSNPTAVKLDPFLVSTDRETDAQSIANNEQRFSPNLKSVMSTDTLGDVVGSSVGEFLKFVPGVTIEYDNSDVASISLRGIGGTMTGVSTDGAPASGTWVTPSRAVDLRAMALNDISRIDVTKVPTPANPADSLAGSVNLITKSAFERKGRELRVGVNFFGNSEELTLQRTPTSYGDRKAYKILPGAYFDFTWPITKRFGLVLTGTTNNLLSAQQFAQTTWSRTGTGTNAVNASPANPYLQSLQINGGLRNIIRNTVSLKADWRVTTNSVLSASFTANRSTTEIANAIVTLNTGTIGTPSITGGVPMTFGPDFTRGATGRGTLTNNGTSQKIPVFTDTSILTYRFDDGYWRAEAGLSRSETRIQRIYTAAGFFWQATSTNRVPVRISYLDFGGNHLPATVEAHDNTNQPVDWKNIDAYRGTVGIDGTADNLSRVDNSYVNLRRSLALLPVPTAVQFGASWRQQIVDMHPTQDRWQFAGPDGVSGTTASLRPYANQVYTGPIYPGYDGIQWTSPNAAWAAYQKNPRLYDKPVAQMFATENYRIDNSEYFKETIQAAYVQAEATLLSNRLKLLGGVRFEQTRNLGIGALTDADAVWQQDARGNFIRNANGARIRRPEAGAVNSLQQIALTRKERGAVLRRTYDGYYPSLHATFSASENILLRAAYARTYGRPDVQDIVPRTVATGEDLDENTPTPVGGRGTLSIRNPSLKPWSADNFDLSLEYYAPKGGTISAGVFLKELKDFFGADSRRATAEDLRELGLDGSYLDWIVNTKFNSGDARITGAELNLRFPLRPLGHWAAPFTVFANGTKLQLDGNPGANFSSFIPKSGNWGLTYSYKRYTVTGRWNYRGLDKRVPQPAYGSDGYEYIQARTTLDLNGAVQLNRRFALTASASNLTNEPLVTLRYGGATPGYARQYWLKYFGIQLSVGLRGTF